MDNYKTIETKLSTLTPFTGNSLTAIADKTWGSISYKVYSYSTLIAEKSWNGNEGEWDSYLNKTKFSVTTSRHQNLIRKAWGI
jgi:hypothetical protein